MSVQNSNDSVNQEQKLKKKKKMAFRSFWGNLFVF